PVHHARPRPDPVLRDPGHLSGEAARRPEPALGADPESPPPSDRHHPHPDHAQRGALALALRRHGAVARGPRRTHGLGGAKGGPPRRLLVIIVDAASERFAGALRNALLQISWASPPQSIRARGGGAGTGETRRS